MNRRSDGKPVVLRLFAERSFTSTQAVAPPGSCGTSTALAGHPRRGGITEEMCPADARAQSWRQGRTMMSGAAILELVPSALRQQLIAEYRDRTGTWPVASSADNATLLQFLAARLPDPSHTFSLCRMEVALTCAATGAEIFVEPEYRSVQGRSGHDLRARIDGEAWGCIERALRARVVTETWDHIGRTSWDSVEGAIWDGIEREARFRLDADVWQIVERSARNRIERGRYASLVWFHAEPGSVLRALFGAPAPPVGQPAYPILFGPGVPNLCRAATAEEATLWQSLPADDTVPDLVERLLTEGIVRYAD